MLLCRMQEQIRAMIYLPNPTECITPRGNSNVNYGLRVISKCPRRFITCNGCPTLMGAVDHGRGRAWGMCAPKRGKVFLKSWWCICEPRSHAPRAPPLSIVSRSHSIRDAHRQRTPEGPVGGEVTSQRQREFKISVTYLQLSV